MIKWQKKKNHEREGAASWEWKLIETFDRLKRIWLSLTLERKMWR